MNIFFHILYFIIIDYLFFGITAKFCGKACNYNCDKCKNWACTHDVPYEKQGFYPVRDWSRWCKGVKK